MKTRIVRIGNSQGVRIPKPLLEQSGLREDDDVELAVEDASIVIRRSRPPREGWADAFRRMAEAGDDVLLDPAETATTEWDEEEWEW